MKSKRRILIGDCSGLYRKKSDYKPVNIDIRVSEKVRGQIDRALLSLDQSVTGNSWFMGGSRVDPDSIRTTQSGPPEEYRSSLPRFEEAP